MSTETSSQVVAKHIAFKPSITTNTMLDVVEQLLAGKQWGDELALTAGPSDRAVVGTAFKILLGAGLIERTGAYRKSGVPAHKGRVCWAYRVPSAAAAETFLKRHQRIPTSNQAEFPLVQ